MARIPESVENLFAYGRLRKAAEEMRILSVDKAAGGLAIKFSETAKVDPQKSDETARRGRRCELFA